MQRVLKKLLVLALGALLMAPAVASAGEEGGFEFHGYMRAGFDFNSNLANPESGDLRLGQLPTDCHSRFGNEGNRSYIEPSFGYTWKKENADEFWKMNLMWSTFYNEGANDAGDTAFNNREAYIMGGGFDFAPSMKVWAGNRYYGREYLPELDWFFTNLIGYGAGFEDIPLGSKARLNIAWVAVHNGQGAWEDNNLIYEDDDLEDKVGELQENNFDFSFHSIPLGDDLTLKAELMLKYIKGGYIDAVNEVKDQLGYYGLVKLNWDKIGTFYGMYLSGAAAAKGPGGWSDAFHREIGRDLDAGDFTDGELDYEDRSQYRFIYSGSFTLGNVGLAPYFVYEYYTNGLDDTAKDERTYIDFGFRANYPFSDLTSVILDIDYATQMRSEGVAGGAEDTEPNMLKITPAYALSFGKFLWSRPTIRFYATYATWNSDAKGDLAAIATNPDDTSYIKYGIQCEAWW